MCTFAQCYLQIGHISRKTFVILKNKTGNNSIQWFFEQLHLESVARSFGFIPLMWSRPHFLQFSFLLISALSTVSIWNHWSIFKETWLLLSTWENEEKHKEKKKQETHKKNKKLKFKIELFWNVTSNFSLVRASGFQICLYCLSIISALNMRTDFNWLIMVIFAKVTIYTITPAGLWLKAEAFTDIENMFPAASQSY